MADMTTGAGIPTVQEHKQGPNLLIRFVWWLFIGRWASAIWIGLAWLIQLTVYRY